MGADSAAVVDFSRFTRWHVITDIECLVDTVSVRIYRAARQAIALRGEFRIVLAGGGTPAAVYRALADTDADWSRWHVYFGDERCLPPTDPERNSVMAADNWLARVAMPQENIHAIPAERGAEPAARAYAELIDAARPFDIVLLGMGEDGHTASLFPGHRHDNARRSVLAVRDAPKPPADRVSLSAAALSDAAAVLVLVTGAGKYEAVQRWKQGEDLPITHVHGRDGVDVYLDPAASTGLQELPEFA